MKILIVVFLIAALAVAVFQWDVTIAEIWVQVDPNSLVGFGALVEKRIDPDLWTMWLLPLLQWPLWVVPLALAILLGLAHWIVRGR